MRPLEVTYSRRAQQHFAAAGTRWRQHHGMSSALRDEIDRIKGLLALNPYMGDEVQNARRPGLRHFYLGRVGFHLYYRVDEERGRLEIVAFWQERRRPLRL